MRIAWSCARRRVRSERTTSAPSSPVKEIPTFLEKAKFGSLLCFVLIITKALLLFFFVSLVNEFTLKILTASKLSLEVIVFFNNYLYLPDLNVFLHYNKIMYFICKVKLRCKIYKRNFQMVFFLYKKPQTINKIEFN